NQRSFYVGMMAAAGGAAAGAGSAAGGVVAQLLPGAWTLLGKPLVAVHGLFLLGAAARFGAAMLGLRGVDRQPATLASLPLRAGGCRKVVPGSKECRRDRRERGISPGR